MALTILHTVLNHTMRVFGATSFVIKVCMMDLESHTECTVSGALAFALRMSRIAGLAPIKFRKVRAGWRVRVSEDIHLYGRSLAVMLCLLAVSVLLTDLLVDPDSSVRMDQHKYHNASTITGVVIMSLITLGGAFTGSHRMRAMISTLDQLQKITVELNHYRRQVKYIEKKKWFILIVMIFGGFSAAFIDYVLSLYEVIKKHGNLLIVAAYIFHPLMLVIQVLLEIQFVLNALTIFTTFDHLNGCLEDFVHDVRSKDVRKSSSKLSPEAVHRLSYLQGCICEAVRQVDASQGLVVLLVISSSIFYLLGTLYNISYSFFTIQVLEGISNNPMRQVMWGALYIYRVFAMVEPCQRTQDAVERTQELVSQLALRSSSRGALAAELAMFTRHLFLNDTAYNPMNMFTLNRQFVVTMMATITTYLVIIEQL